MNKVGNFISEIVFKLLVLNRVAEASEFLSAVLAEDPSERERLVHKYWIEDPLYTETFNRICVRNALQFTRGADQPPVREEEI